MEQFSNDPAINNKAHAVKEALLKKAKGNKKKREQLAKEIQREIAQQLKSAQKQGKDAHANLDAYYAMQSWEMASGKPGPTFTVRKGDTLADITSLFEHKNGKAIDWKELQTLNGIEDPKKLDTCHILKIPRDWILREDASEEHRERLDRKSWPGDETVCTVPLQAIEKIEDSEESGEPEGKLDQLKEEDDDDLPLALGFLAAAPKAAAKMTKLGDLLEPGDLITYENAKGRVITEQFVEYAESTGKIRLISSRGHNPTYYINAHSVQQVQRGGELLDLTTIRLNKYLKPKAIRVIKSLELSPTEVAELELELARDPKSAAKINEFLSSAKYPKSARFVKNFRKYGSIAYVCLVLYGFDMAKNKTDYLLESTAELGGFVTGMKATSMLTTGRIIHPVGKLAVDLAGGLIVAAGGSKVYREYATPQLDKYFPNRNQTTDLTETLEGGLQTMGAFAGSSAIETADLILEKTGVKGGVDAETEPLVYLSKTVTMANTGNFSEGVWKKYMVRNLKQFHEEATKTYNELLAEIAPHKLALKEHEKKHKGALKYSVNKYPELKKHFEALAKLEPQLKVLKKFVKTDKEGRPLWIGEKLEHLDQQKKILQYLTILFANTAEEKFNGRGGKFVNDLVKRLEQGKKAKLVHSNESDIWKDLLKSPVTIGGDSVTFADFVSLIKLNNTQSKQMEDIVKYGDLSGARI